MWHVARNATRIKRASTRAVVERARAIDVGAPVDARDRVVAIGVEGIFFCLFSPSRVAFTAMFHSTSRTNAWTGMTTNDAFARGRRARTAWNVSRARANGRRTRAITRAGNVKKMNAEELEIAMANRDRPMVIDFYATWCGPCVLMSAELEKVQKELGDGVLCVKVDTDEENELATQLQIQGLPTLVFVSTDKSKPALRTEGMLPAETVINVVRNELS